MLNHLGVILRGEKCNGGKNKNNFRFREENNRRTKSANKEKVNERNRKEVTFVLQGGPFWTALYLRIFFWRVM